jgi:hypothetical protein
MGMLEGKSAASRFSIKNEGLLMMDGGRFWMVGRELAVGGEKGRPKRKRDRPVRGTKVGRFEGVKRPKD